MSVMLTPAQTADKLLAAQDILILTHRYPDGDTLGGAFALCRGLRQSGKRAQAVCADELPEKYAYLWEGLPAQAFTPRFICAVDVADTKLLGEEYESLGKTADLCIDHHASNTGYASQLLLRGDYAAASMLVCEVLRAMGVRFDRAVAEAVYTGIATDTGCFKYANTDAYVHRMAADMLECGVRADAINRAMFDTKSRARIELERMALSGMHYYAGGRCAVMPITVNMIEQSGATEDDMEGLSPLPRQIEGVWIGVTLRELSSGGCRISVRTGSHANAAAICEKLGGGGHQRAAGCTLNMPVEKAVQAVLQAARETVPSLGE